MVHQLKKLMNAKNVVQMKITKKKPQEITECNRCGHFLEPFGSCVMCPHIDGTCGCCESISNQTSFKSFLEKTFDRRMEISEHLREKRDDFIGRDKKIK